MEQAVFSPYPYLSWLGTWRATGRNETDIEFGMRQVAHALIYTTRGKADVLWKHSGREDRFRVDGGTVRFCPADDDYHTLIGRRCEPGHRFYTLLIPRGHLVQLAATEGISAMPELRHSVFRGKSLPGQFDGTLEAFTHPGLLLLIHVGAQGHEVVRWLDGRVRDFQIEQAVERGGIVAGVEGRAEPLLGL